MANIRVAVEALRSYTQANVSGTVGESSEDVGLLRDRGLLLGRSGCFWGGPGTFWGSLGDFRGTSGFAIPATIYRSAPGPRAGKCPPECFLSDFGHLPASAPKSAFWRFLSLKAPKSTQKALFGTLGGRCPKSLKKHSGGHFPARGPGTLP